MSVGLLWACTLAGLLLACGSTSAAPAQESQPDSFVVSVDPISSGTTDAAQITEAISQTTETSLAPLKVTSMEVTSEVTLRYAHTTVLTRMKNPSQRSQEATFSLILPETAFISGFIMTLDGKDYKAYVKEKEEAKQAYSSAVAQGLGAAHISAKARDSNHFTVRVNIEPMTEAHFNLTYEELLELRNGVYNHAINLNPGRVVPQLKVVVHIKEGKKITTLRVPEMRTGNEIDASELDAQNPNAVIDKSSNGKEATITFTPDIAEQTRLMDIYAQKTRESRAKTEQSYRYYNRNEDTEPAPEGVLGQFVVQYAVERSTNGEIFLNDGHFVHFFAPLDLKPLNKHIVFVLDTSGSMMDRKIIQLREAMASILDELKEGDYFNIVEFASDTHVYELSEANEDKKPSSDYYFSYNERMKPVKLVPPSPATTDNIRLAKIIISRLTANGGTNINEALTTALQLVNRGVGWKVKETQKAEAVSTIAQEPDQKVEVTLSTTAATTAVAEPKNDKAAKPEPIIIFLTDGDPTVGEVDPKVIVKRISELNTGDKRAALFSLAFGEDADRTFLRKISLRNEGFMRHIYEAADAAAQLKNFYSQVSSPLLANIKFVYPPGQIEEGSLTKTKFRTLYKGSEVVVAGRLAPLKQDEYFSPTVTGICGVKDEEEFKSVSRIPVKRDENDFGPLERLWAYMTIKQKLDEKDAAADDDTPSGEDGPEKEALRLALKYSFVTPLTSLVVVKPNATSAVDAESVDKKQPYPSASMGFAVAGLPGPPSSFQQSYSGAGGSYSSALFMRPAMAYDSMVFEAEEDELDSPPPYGRRAFLRGRLVSKTSYVPSQQLPETKPPSFSYSSLLRRPTMGFKLSQVSFDQIPNQHIGGHIYPAAYQPPSPPIFLTTAAIYTTSVSPPVDPLKEYHLEDFPWIKNFINTSDDTVQLTVNSTVVTLKLLKDATGQFTTFSSAGAVCTSVINDQSGTCTYLAQCDAAKSITFDLYKRAYCERDGYAGVCCPTQQTSPSSPAAPISSAGPQGP